MAAKLNISLKLPWGIWDVYRTSKKIYAVFFITLKGLIDLMRASLE